MYKDYSKRLLDIIGSITLLSLCLPLFFLLTLIIIMQDRQNPFFLQQRSGLDGRLFYLIKYRTMSNRSDEQGKLLPDNERTTSVGSFFRKLSLDELPQLINVLKGDMSLIGPRPLLPEYLPLYNEFQKRRHEIRPGITGWAQINGRNALSWNEKFQHDIWYVDNVNILLDLKILFITMIKLFNPKEIYSITSIPPDIFKGQ